jgi:hypothetical protein
MALTARRAVASGFVCRAQAASGKAPGCAERAPANKPDIKANTASMASVHTPKQSAPLASQLTGCAGANGADCFGVCTEAIDAVFALMSGLLAGARSAQPGALPLAA